MRRHHDSTIQRIVVNNVADDQVVVDLGRIVTGENSPSIISYQVVSNDRVIGAEKMDPFSAIKILSRFENRLAGARFLGRVEALIVVHHNVICHGDARGIGDQDSLEVGVLDCETRHDDIVQAGIVKTVDVDAIGKANSVDDRPLRIRADQ